MGIEKSGAAALDDIILGMTSSPVGRVKQLLKAGHTTEAIREADSLTVSELQKLAEELEVEKEHVVEPNTDKGDVHGENPDNDEAEIHEVEGDGDSDGNRAPTQIEEEKTANGLLAEILGKEVVEEGDEEPKEEPKEESKEEPEEEEEDSKEVAKEEIKEETKEEEKVAVYRKAVIKAYVLGSKKAAKNIEAYIRKGR